MIWLATSGQLQANRLTEVCDAVRSSVPSIFPSYS